LFGAPVHAAASSGVPQLLRLMIEAGGDVNALNAQKQTPLQGLRYFRVMASQVQAMNLGALGAAMGKNLQAELEKVMPAPEALDECERLLIDHGGR
jgi:hypothetical protein